MSLMEKLLEIAAENIKGMEKEEAIYWLDNDAVPEYGSVSGLIYYDETEAIAKEHFSEILKLMKEIGIACPTSFDVNDMAWFAWSYLILGNGKEVYNSIIEKKY